MEPQNWARSLEFVLSDRPALDAFQEWLIEYSSPQYLDLHFAIRAYDRMVMEKNPKRTELARTIYCKFLSSKTGNCETIPSRIRSQILERIRHAISSETDSDRNLFSNCSSFVEDFLRRQHEQFVHSDEFIDAFNKIALSTDPMSTLDRRKMRKNEKNATLTAETLLLSREDRQNKLGEIKLEKMYPPTRYPYVCNATTSHNDSAVSSSFSADTPSSHRASRLRHARDEQFRGNLVGLTLPRVDNSNRSTEGQQFDHSSDIGRKKFAWIITSKLLRIIDKMKLNDETEKKINDIEQCKYTTRDMVNGTEASEDMEKLDEDDELDDYLKRMRDDSQRQSASRSPHVNNPNVTFSPGRDKKHIIDRMSQSMVDYSVDTFAPPPLNHTFHHFTSSRDNNSQLYDSSGIGSMAPSAFSASSESSRDRRAHHHHHTHHRQRFTPRKHHKSVAKPGGDMSQLITISYVGPDRVPFVAHVPNNGPMTLAEFRQYFMLSPNSQQLFFKTECEDGSAPFQLLLIKEDHSILPVFEGRITAELR